MINQSLVSSFNSDASSSAGTLQLIDGPTNGKTIRRLLDGTSTQDLIISSTQTTENGPAGTVRTLIRMERTQTDATTGESAKAYCQIIFGVPVNPVPFSGSGRDAVLSLLAQLVGILSQNVEPAGTFTVASHTPLNIYSVLSQSSSSNVFRILTGEP